MRVVTGPKVEPAHRVLDRLLDRVAVDGGPFSFSHAARLDRLEEFPFDAVRILDEAGLGRWFVPVAHGGLLDDVVELMQMLRMVSRRDLTVAIAYGKTFLGAVPVWVGGSPEHVAGLAERICHDMEMVTWAMTERGHGADLLSGEVRATPTDGGWVVDGAKWLINNATRAPLVSLLARSAVDGGARGFTLFLIDKRDLPAGSWRCLPREPTHGIRGADISGIEFTGARVPQEAVVGAVGAGLEIVLKSLQVTRTACVALSLGAADHALRLAAGYASRRSVYGRTLAELPNVRWVLANCAATALLAEVVAVVGGRSVHALAGEMSVTAAVTKAFVPTVVDGLIVDIGELLGARGLVLDDYADGRFEKLERDHRIVGIFDGSTVVNRATLITQFPILVRAHRSGRVETGGLATVFDLGAALPGFDTAGLALISRGGSSVVQSLPASVQRIRALASGAEVPQALVRLAELLAQETEQVLTDIAGLRPAFPAESAAFDLARRYELCFAGAASLGVWLHTPAVAGALWTDAVWPTACLLRVLLLMGRIAEEDCTAAYESLAELVLADHGCSVLAGLTGGGS